MRTAWPSGLRRYVQVVVRKGVGSNPTAVILFQFHVRVLLDNQTIGPNTVVEMELAGIDPATSRMLSERSTI